MVEGGGVPHARRFVGLNATPSPQTSYGRRAPLLVSAAPGTYSGFRGESCISERHFGPHRYRHMLAAGINVCLGTDSIVNLPPDAFDRGLSILDEMRFLFARDRTDPRSLLRMATINGALALGLPSETFMFAPDQPLAGVLACDVGLSGGRASDPLASILSSMATPELLFIDTNSGATGTAFLSVS